LSGNVTARRYARALFSVGAREGREALEKIAADLRALRASMEASEELSRFYLSPAFSVEEKERVIKALAEIYELGEHARNFCRLLSENGRLACLPGIAEIFDAMLDAENGVLRGELTTAVELDENRLKNILNQLEKQIKRGLTLRCKVDSSILGGVILKVGDQVLDASLRAQLSVLKEQITRGE
jgi:F-type H+-transporting ATPase subunit delta